MLGEGSQMVKGLVSHLYIIIADILKNSRLCIGCHSNTITYFSSYLIFDVTLGGRYSSTFCRWDAKADWVSNLPRITLNSSIKRYQFSENILRIKCMYQIHIHWTSKTTCSFFIRSFLLLSHPTHHFRTQKPKAVIIFPSLTILSLLPSIHYHFTESFLHLSLSSLLPISTQV